MTQYHNRDALLYDSYATGVKGDVEFHVTMARESEGFVMEMGCGTGRLLIPIAREGIDIIGVDRESAMLDIAEQKIARAPSTAGRKRDRYTWGDAGNRSCEGRDAGPTGTAA